VRLSKPDVIVIFNDSVIVSNFLIELKKEPQIISKKVRIIVYLDQVYPTQRIDLLSIIAETAHHIISFTDYWKKELLKQNVNIPITTLMHAFDDETFKPLKSKKPPNAPMLVLNLNRNQPRKRLDIMAMAMAQLFIKRPDANINFVIGSDARNGAWDVPFIVQVELSRTFEMSKVQYFMGRVLTLNNAGRMTDVEINELYNHTDVGLNTCCGEGVGLNQLEHAGVGKPQIVPALGGLTDYLNDKNAILLEPKYRLWAINGVELMGGEQRFVDPVDVADAVLKYYDDSVLREEHGAQARKDMLKLNWADVATQLYDLLLTV
jgi:glycosyltransferase involved in cell wall biosynthesis